MQLLVPTNRLARLFRGTSLIMPCVLCVRLVSPARALARVARRHLRRSADLHGSIVRQLTMGQLMDLLIAVIRRSWTLPDRQTGFGVSDHILGTLMNVIIRNGAMMAGVMLTQLLVTLL